jgi:hypothetical protein
MTPQAIRSPAFPVRAVAAILAFVAVNAALAHALSDYDNGRFTMPWWVIELITNIVLVALAVFLGPFIKRFGRSYAADVFRANPAHRQELPGSHGRRLLLDLLVVHPLHRDVRRAG